MKFVSVGDLNGDGRDDVLIEAIPQIGTIRTFDLHVGAKTGFATKRLASYNMSDNYRVPERRLPPTPQDSP